jgi:hypothetical protein
MIVAIALSGCATDQSAHSDHHVLKCDLIFDRVIGNPYEWALQQFADGPITGPHVSDYARCLLADGFQQAVADLGNNRTQELFLRQGSSGRVWEVLVFTPVGGGFRYIGHFTAGPIVLNPGQPSVLVFEACGGHDSFIKTYRHDGARFACVEAQAITADATGTFSAAASCCDSLDNWMRMTSFRH